jgi:hypothetical protein
MELQELEFVGSDSTESAQDRIKWLVLGIHKGGNILDQLSESHFLKNNSVLSGKMR